MGESSNEIAFERLCRQVIAHEDAAEGGQLYSFRAPQLTHSCLSSFQPYTSFRSTSIVIPPSGYVTLFGSRDSVLSALRRMLSRLAWTTKYGFAPFFASKVYLICPTRDASLISAVPDYIYSLAVISASILPSDPASRTLR